MEREQKGPTTSFFPATSTNVEKKTKKKQKLFSDTDVTFQGHT